jgi:hypothetical protein
LSLSKNFFSRHLSPDKTRKSHLDFPAYGFTSVGKQILSLIDNVTPNVDFFKKQLKKITHDEKCRCGYISDSDEHPFKIGKIIFEL